MGAFIDNLHVRDVEHTALVGALQDMALTPAYISTESGQIWTGVYPKGCEHLHGGSPLLFASDLSARLSRPVIAFTVHDSDVFWYWLFDNGAIVDNYDSAPNYFEDGSKTPSGGNAEALKPYCLDVATREQIDTILHPRPEDMATFAEDIACNLAKIMGISTECARASFGYIMQGDIDTGRLFLVGDQPP